MQGNRYSAAESRRARRDSRQSGGGGGTGPFGTSRASACCCHPAFALSVLHPEVPSPRETLDTASAMAAPTSWWEWLAGLWNSLWTPRPGLWTPRPGHSRSAAGDAALGRSPRQRSGQAAGGEGRRAYPPA